MQVHMLNPASLYYCSMGFGPSAVICTVCLAGGVDAARANMAPQRQRSPAPARERAQGPAAGTRALRVCVYIRVCVSVLYPKYAPLPCMGLLHA